MLPQVGRRLAARLASIAAGPAPQGYHPSFATMHGIRARVVDTVDHQQLRTDTLAAVSAALEAGRVPHVLVPQRHRPEPRLAVAAEAQAGAVAALSRALVAREWAVQAGAVPICSPPSWRAARPVGSADMHRLGRYRILRLFRVLVAADGSLLAGPDAGCHVEFWTLVSGTRCAPDPDAVEVAALSVAEWRAGCETPRHWGTPVLGTGTSPIG